MTPINQLYAGAAQVDITPPPGTRINGDFKTHFATFIHDPLYAKCLILRNDHEIMAWVIVDICTMSQAFIDEVKSHIHELTHIPVRNILIASTHTHAAGAIEEVHLGALDMAYRRQLALDIPQAVVLAKDKLRPAEFTWGRIELPDHVLCRRYYMTVDYTPVNPVTGEADRIKTNPFGLEQWIDRPVANPDPEIYYIVLRGLEHEWISVLGNYSLHYVGDWENGTISSDYFGVFAKAVKENLKAGDDFVAMMTNGTSGDINIWDFEGKKNYPKAHFEKSKLIGEDVASKVTDSISKNTRWVKTANLEVKNNSLSLPVRKPDTEALNKALRIVGQSNYENFIYSDDGLRMAYAREQVLLNEEDDERKVPLQGFKIDDLIIGTLPGEFFAETGLALKKANPARGYFSICLANGNVGYVPPAHEIERGGYETWRCRYSCLVTDAESKIRTEMKKMIKELTKS